MADGTERALVNGGESYPRAGSHRRDRLLALEIRPRKLGFVVFEGPTRLLDWGVRSFVGKENELSAVVGKKIDTLLNLYAPSTVVLQQRHGPTAKADTKIGIVVRTIRTEAKRHAIEFQFLGAQTVRRFFTQYGSATKHGIASILAEWFEDLAWKLPPKRKPWQSEDHNMAIFDAAATGVTFFASPGKGEGHVLQ